MSNFFVPAFQNQPQQQQHASSSRHHHRPAGPSYFETTSTTPIQPQQQPQPQQFIPQQQQQQQPQQQPTAYATGLEMRMGYVQASEASQVNTQADTTPAEIIPITECPSEIMSCTLGVLPQNSQLLSNTTLPFGITLCPLSIIAERVEDNPNTPVPIVPYGSTGIVRCRVCRTYINPYAEWLEGGRRWRCNLCGLVNEVPGTYYSPILPETGQRKDIYKKPELTHGCVEFVAPGEYMARPPMAPSFVFVIDATYTAISSGFFASTISAIKSWIHPNAEANENNLENSSLNEQTSKINSKLKKNPRTKVAFFVYDGAVHAFSLRPGSKTPRMLTVPDLSFASSGSGAPALPAELFVTLSDCQDAVDGLLERLPAMFTAQTASSARHAGVAYGPALACAINACKHSGARILSFLSGAPSLGQGGAALLPPRDPTLPGNTKARTEREAQLAQPRNDACGEYYKNIALDCSQFQITIDVVSTASASRHIELATIAQLAQFTGGDVIYMPNFSRARDGPSYERTIVGMLNRPIVWEAVMRTRCSKNIAIANHYGHMFVRTLDLLVLPASDMGKGFCTALKLTDQLPGGYAYLQNALLYTSSSGERRIRVSTLRLPVSSDPRQIFDAVNPGAMIALLAKAAADKLSYTASLVDARELVVRHLIRALAAYKRLVAGGSAAMMGSGPVAMPQSMAVVPLYVLGLLKHPALIIGAEDVKPDMRAAAIASLRSLPSEHMLVAMHPQLFNLNMIPDDGENVFPPPQTLTSSSISRDAIMLFNTGDSIILLVGKDVSQDVLMAAFGTASMHEAAAICGGVPVVEGSQYNAAIRKIVDALIQARVQAGLSYPTVSITADERILQVLLVDDHIRHFYSYQEFVTQLQRNVEKELSN